MNLDDETFLSAYLDGQLAPEQRQRVESAMLSDPRLLDHLHSLAAVRELVAGLSRPPLGLDLSAHVTDAIERRRRAGVLAFALRAIPATPREWAVRGVAASVLFGGLAVTFALPRGVKPMVPTPLVRVERPRPAPEPPRVAPEPDPAPELTAPVEPVDELTALDAPPLSAADQRHEGDRRLVRDLLDRGDLKALLFVSTLPGVGVAEAPRKVGQILEQSSLRNARFGRINVSQGVHIDPDHPGEATVFVVLMDEGELRTFRKALADSFHEAVAEAAPRARPELVTRLANVDDVAVVQGTAVADLVVPDGPPRALRDDEKNRPVKKSVIDVNGRVFRQADAEPLTIDAPSTPGHEPGPLAGSSPEPTSPDGKSIVVDRRTGSLILIWVGPGPKPVVGPKTP